MVGYLVWRSDRSRGGPVFEPARGAVPDPVRSKLRYLVIITAPDSFERLQGLRSEFWSFVPLHVDERERRSSGDLS